MTSLRPSLLLLLVLAAGPAVAAGAGFRALEVKDPVAGKAMRAIVFYPTSAPAQSTQLGPYLVAAGAGAPVAPGRHPLVVISHGHGGTRLGHHDLATALAREGFVVASVDHPGNNARDLSGTGTDTVYLGRPLQMSALIDAVLATPGLGASVDAARIGAVGFSAGGYTVLALAGARPEPRLWERYCSTHPDAGEVCKGGGRMRVLHPELKPKADPRVRALVVMAPLAIPLDAISRVRVPVRLYAAEKDEVLAVKDNAERVRRELPRPPEYRLLPGAGHYVFLAPCSGALQKQIPALCEDPPGIDREQLHAELAAETLAFFRRTLAR